MSTLRISNIEAKSVPASATIDEKVKITNSSGDPLVFIDGKTSGITTVGINTTDANITFDANSNVVVTGIITATKFVGTIEPTNLTVGGDLTIPDKIIHTGDTNTAIRFPAADTITAETGGSEALRITSEGALLLSTAGTRRNTKGSSQYQAFLIEGTTNNTTRMSMIRSSNDDNGPEIQIIKTRGTSVGSVTKPNQNDYLGAFVFLAGDDSDLFTRAAEISVQATGTPANDRCPSDMMFSTTPTSGASTPQERLRITSTGAINLTSENTTGWQLDAGDNSASYTAIDNHFPTTNRTLYINNETTHRSIAFWNKNGSDGYGFGLDNSGNFKVVYGTSERVRINSNGEFVMSDSSTKTFIDLETTGNNTRAIMSLKGKTSGGGDVHLIMGGYGDTNRGEIFTYTNHDLGFATNNAAAQFKCKTNGNFEIVNGDLVVASGHGIDFSATANSAGTSTSELLDDYEEGSCVPTQINGSFTPSSADGKYTKVGRLVTWMMHINFDSTASNNHLKIGNLPFTAGSGRSGTAIVRYSNDDEAFKIAWHVDALNATAVAYYLDGGALVPSNAVSQKRFDLTFVYEAT